MYLIGLLPCSRSCLGPRSPRSPILLRRGAVQDARPCEARGASVCLPRKVFRLAFVPAHRNLHILGAVVGLSVPFFCFFATVLISETSSDASLRPPAVW